MLLRLFSCRTIADETGAVSLNSMKKNNQLDSILSVLQVLGSQKDTLVSSVLWLLKSAVSAASPENDMFTCGTAMHLSPKVGTSFFLKISLLYYLFLSYVQGLCVYATAHMPHTNLSFLVFRHLSVSLIFSILLVKC